MEKVICKHCGKTVENDFINSKELNEKQECFSCNFWINHLVEDEKRFKEHRAFVEYPFKGELGVIENDPETLYHWVIADEDNTSAFRGCAGAKVEVTFPDGTVVQSTNLWHQGTVPGHLRKYFTRFIAKLTWK